MFNEEPKFQQDPGTFGHPDRRVHIWTVIKQGRRGKEQKAEREG